MGAATALMAVCLAAPLWAADSDADGLEDTDELRWGTDPLTADSDRDGLTDGAEVSIHTDPRRFDTDGDAVPDGGEAVVLGTDPRWSEQDCTPWPTLPVIADPNPVAVMDTGDIDGDGLIDIVWGLYGTDISWARNEGGGVFTTHLITDSLYYETVSLEVVDMEPDGDLDVVVGKWTGGYLLPNLGGGTFAPWPTLVTPGLAWYEVVAAKSGDLGGNASRDVVGWLQGNSVLGVYKNPGWEEKYRLTGGPWHTDVKVEDIDGDGAADLVSVHHDSVEMRRRTGSYQFAQPVKIADDWGIVGAVFGDLDEDGDLDLVTTNAADVSWYRNHGRGAFGPRKTVSQTPDLQSPALADLDADGRPDLVAADNERIVWFRNLGGRFGNELSIGDSPALLPVVVAADLAGAPSLPEVVSTRTYEGLVLHLNDNEDTDLDGLPFRAESCVVGTDPSRRDSDGGGADDLDELVQLTDPRAPADDVLIGLEPPDPGLAGESNTWRMTGATPGSPVGVMYARKPGRWAVPGCQALTLPLDRPVLLGTAIASPDGSAEVTTPVPTDAAGRGATFVALEPTTCKHSALLTHTFP